MKGIDLPGIYLLCSKISLDHVDLLTVSPTKKLRLPVCNSENRAQLEYPTGGGKSSVCDVYSMLNDNVSLAITPLLSLVIYIGANIFVILMIHPRNHQLESE
jgi:hypothetical protein